MVPATPMVSKLSKVSKNDWATCPAISGGRMRSGSNDSLGWAVSTIWRLTPSIELTKVTHSRSSELSVAIMRPPRAAMAAHSRFSAIVLPAPILPMNATVLPF